MACQDSIYGNGMDSLNLIMALGALVFKPEEGQDLWFAGLPMTDLDRSLYSGSRIPHAFWRRAYFTQL